MNATTPQTVLIGTFVNRARAEEYVEELRRAGFRDDEIGIVTPRDEPAHTEAGETALAGALTGGTMGALAGMALVAVGLVPGVAPMLAGGLLVGGLGGAAAGATAGGVMGGLLGLGIPEEEARQYEEHLRAGRTLVAVQAPARCGEALAILRRHEHHPQPS